MLFCRFAPYQMQNLNKKNTDYFPFSKLGNFRIPAILILLSGLLVFGFFGFLGYCSFPISDDFVMAQYTGNGFLWAINYWLGFWLSAWFTVALEISIPMAFGYLDYGIWFFVFVSLTFFSSVFLVVDQLFEIVFERKNRVVQFIISSLIFTVYLLYVNTISETIYWQIGAIAYTIALSTFLFLVAGHLFTLKSGFQLPPKRHILYWILFSFLILSGLFSIWYFKQINPFIKSFDQIFTGKSIYLLWLLFLGLIIFLAVKGKNYGFLHFVLFVLLIFLSVGSGPQMVLLTNAYLGMCLIISLFNRSKDRIFNLLGLIFSLLSTLVVYKLPGTQNRINVTTGKKQDGLIYLYRGFENLLDSFFIDRQIWVIYLLLFVFGLLSAHLLNLSLKNSNSRHILFRSNFVLSFLAVLAIFSCGLIIQFSTKGYFPPRLVSNFTGLFIVVSLLGGLFFENRKILQKIPIQITIGLSILIFSLILWRSENLKNAVKEIQSGEAIAFRRYKLDSFRLINECKIDTCEVPLKEFKLKSISDQFFLLPTDRGFVIDHKLFISKFFKKHVIRHPTPVQQK